MTGSLAACLLAWAAVAASSGEPRPGTAVARVADQAPAYAVEDFAYPQAGEIHEEKGLLLKRGDGHITLADCRSGTDLLHVMARGYEEFCFRTTGDSGWLTMELPNAYLVMGNDYATEVDMTRGTETKTYDIEKNTWTGVGETVENGREYTLMEIRTTK
ncbi:hypothetical protein [Streptomyces sp. NPDC056987]|uniref:hypothetical protein n=1 Tax=Streptomyces sp. NPDC056987 TaxID=3345988 RepID=UPI00363CECFF